MHQEFADAGLLGYNIHMNKKADLRNRQIRRIEQLIEYGLHGEKLDARLVRKYWQEISIDNSTRKLLAFFLWPRKYQSYYLPHEEAAQRVLLSMSRTFKREKSK